MNEPRIGINVDDEDRVWIGLHKRGALLGYLAEHEFDTDDPRLFREMVLLQYELRAMRDRCKPAVQAKPQPGKGCLLDGEEMGLRSKQKALPSIFVEQKIDGG